MTPSEEHLILVRFILIVEDMRRAQNECLRSKSIGKIKAAKAKEEHVDKTIALYFKHHPRPIAKGNAVQIDLF